MQRRGGRVPLYAGTVGHHARIDPRDAGGGSRRAPISRWSSRRYFVQPSQDELVEHFRAVARATRLPVMLYNNPPRTQVNILPKTLARADGACRERRGHQGLERRPHAVDRVPARGAPPRAAVLGRRHGRAGDDDAWRTGHDLARGERLPEADGASGRRAVAPATSPRRSASRTCSRRCARRGRWGRSRSSSRKR